MLIILALLVVQVGFAKGVSVCDYAVSLNSSDHSIDLASLTKYPQTCTWNLTAPQNTTVVVKVTDILLTGALDRVVFLDGTSRTGPALEQCGMGCSLNNVIVVSSKNSMQVMIDTSTNQTKVNLVAYSQDQGGRFNDRGVISFSNSTSNTSIYQLHSNSYPDVKQMQVYINDSLMYPNSVIKVYDGNSESDPLLANFRGTNQFVPITGSGRDLLVVAQHMDNKQLYFSGTFTDVAPGCHQVSPGSSGTFSLDRKNLNTSCDWFINPVNSEGNILLEIISVSICGNETIVIYEGLSIYGQRLATINKDTVLSTYPKMFATTQRGLSIFITEDQTSSNCPDTAVISGTYTVVPDCSGTLKSSGTITSPSYPNQYPLNAVCTWSTQTTDKPKSLYVTMETIDLTNNNNITVSNGNQHFGYTGHDLPSDLVTMVTNNSSATLQFDSNTGNLGTGVEVPGQGFRLTYKMLDCGNCMLMSNGTVSSLTDVPAGAKECIWVITVPPQTGNDTVNIVSFNVDVQGKTGQDLEFRDGGRQDSPLLSLDASKSTSYLTRHNKLWIRYKKNVTDLDIGVNNKTSFSIFFKTYGCDSKHRCKNGLCLHPDWKCNGVDNCGDNTDEVGCSSSSVTKGVKVWLVAVLCVICFLVGGLLMIVIPAVWKRVKYRNYSQFKDFIDPSIS